MPGAGLFKVDDPGKFPLAAAGQIDAAPELNVTGVVSADVSRTIPVITLASGRVIEVLARLGDTVTKGQLLMKVQSADIAGAYSDYEQALADETLAKAQLDRAKILFEKGAIAQKDLEVAQDAETKAAGHRQDYPRPLARPGRGSRSPVRDRGGAGAGCGRDHRPTGDQRRRRAGLVLAQSVHHFGSFAHLDSLRCLRERPVASASGRVRGRQAERLSEPGFQGAHRQHQPRFWIPTCARPRCGWKCANPGSMRLGMFVTATFHGLQKETHATVPAPAVLHLHDRDWVYVPADGGQFRRVEVTGGKMLPGNLQEVVAGIRPGQQVVSNALVLQATAEQ